MKQITAIQTYDGQVFYDKTAADLYLDKQFTDILYKVAGEVSYKHLKIYDIAEILKDSLPELQKANDILTDLQTYETE